MNVDVSFEIFKEICREILDNTNNIVTEEDAKVQIILRVLTESLNWGHSNIAAERKHDNGFSDFLIVEDEKNLVLIEAKRISNIKINVSNKKKLHYLKISGPGLTHVTEGISQAASYAQENGVPIAILTDGLAWIIFKPIVPSENYREKQAIVFPSLEAIIDNFLIFYEFIGRDSVDNKIYNLRFDELHNTRVLQSNPLSPAISKSEIFRTQKSSLAFDLEPVFDTFFSRMTGEDDPNLIIECFVETKESRITDHYLEKMTARVLGNISSVTHDVARDLSDYISSAVDLDSGESIFIVGPTGAGKSTFIERFFRKTLDESVRKKCIPVRINFLEAPGSAEATTNWTAEQLITQLECELFENGTPNWEQLRGLYFTDYERRRVGAGAKLYERNKAEFQEKFGQFMEEKVEKDRIGYLKRLLSDIVHNRKKLPVLIADNTDEFSKESKEAIFQFLQSLRISSRNCILILPITDKSAWAFTKSDIFSIYKSRSFFLPTPPPREVFRKRIEYLKARIRTEDDKFLATGYMTDNKIRVSIKNLAHFAEVIEDAFVNDEFAARILGELSNYNIRRTLRLARRIITSPIYQIEDLIVAYTSGSGTFDRHRKFLNALLKGDYNFYNKDDVDSNEILPIFQVDHKFRQSPLMHLRILILLEEIFNGGNMIEDRYLEVSNILDYFMAVGCQETAIDRSLIFLLDSNLIEPFDPSVRTIAASQRLGINDAGRVHLRLARNNIVFFEQMALTTEIADADVASLMHQAHNVNEPLHKKFAAIRTLFSKYLIDEDKKDFSFPIDSPTYRAQVKLLEDIRGYATIDNRHIGSQISASSTPIDEIFHEGVIGTVDFFDPNKGFGFVDVPEIGERCYIGADVLKNGKIDAVNDGDDILCDIGFAEKGPKVVEVHDIQNRPHEIEILNCEIIKIFDNRGYGFASVSGRNDDAFFHVSLFSDFEGTILKIGTRFEAQVRTDSIKESQQIRKIVRIYDR